MFSTKKQGVLRAADVKRSMVVSGRGAEVLRDVAGLPAEVLDGRHHPCPHCGGTDRFRLLDGRTGEVFCNHGCWDGRKSADVLTVIQTMRGVSFREALAFVADYVGAGGGFPPAGSCFESRSMAKAPPVVKPKAPKGKPIRVTHYDYADGEGRPYIRVTRRDYADRSKDFLPSRWDAVRGAYAPGIAGLERVPFNAPEVKAADYVYFVEGEKCAVVLKEHLRETGKLTPDVAVTCIVGGTNGWKPELAAWFAGKWVHIFPDNDDPGYQFVWAVKRHIERAGVEHGRASIVTVFQWPPGTPPKWDIADELEKRKEGGQ